MKNKTIVDAIPPRYIECRVRGHYWRNVDAWKEAGTFKQSLRCRFCSTVVLETITSNGYLKSRMYKYPEDYLVKGGVSAVGRRELRVKLFANNYNPRTKR